jgi:hypothetical protein
VLHVHLSSEGLFWPRRACWVGCRAGWSPAVGPTPPLPPPPPPHPVPPPSSDMGRDSLLRPHQDSATKHHFKTAVGKKTCFLLEKPSGFWGGGVYWFFLGLYWVFKIFWPVTQHFCCILLHLNVLLDI